MKKTRFVIMAVLALLAAILYLQGERIAAALKSASPGFTAESGIDDGGNAGVDAAGDQNGKSTGKPAGANAADNPYDMATGGLAGANAAGADKNASLLNGQGMTVRDRILVPAGFERVVTPEGSFGEYLRNLPLKLHGSKVTYHNGGTKPYDVHVAVLDMDVGSRDLQQCADSVIRLRAEYLYGKGLYDRIHFNFTCGFNAEYAKWIEGNRIKVSGNNAVWVKQGDKGAGYASFRRYLDMVFAYAGTLSLSKEMERVTIDTMQPGDVFLSGGTPGHCVIVLDMAENAETGGKIFILAQGYMPAQDMHILKNPSDDEGDPWYSVDIGDELVTPEWTFTKDQLYRFKD